MTKVVVTDFSFPNLDVEERILAPLGYRLEGRQCRTPAELMAVVADADVVVTQFAPVNAQVVAAMQRVRGIVRYGIGVDNVDVEAARLRGIPVCNVPDYCIDEVADHTLAFILATTRQVVGNCLHVRAGSWGLPVPLAEMKVLRELTVGVIGFGRIGREVVRRLLPFKCAVHVYDPVVPTADVAAAGAVEVGSLNDLLACCDVLTLHCPSTPATRGMINRETLTKLRPGAILVNVARGNLVDTGALVEALQTGRLAAAALDVCDPEPIPPGHPLLSLPNVLVAAHVASASTSAVNRLRETVARTVISMVQGEPLANVVNGVGQSR